MYVPFCPLPIKRAKIVSKKFFGLADRISKMFPNLEMSLKQSGMQLDRREYIGIVLFSALFTFAVTFLLILVVSLIAVPAEKAVPVSMLVSLSLSAMTFFYLRTYPKLLVKKKVANLERNLIYALKHLYVQVKSGVTIYDSIVSVSKSDYGRVSEEFRKVVNYVGAGMSMEAALENIGLENPSVYFHRVLWQISNGIKSGSDIGTVLKSVVDNISHEQRIAIRRYGSQLNPLTLVYMMFAVIIPSLGITFLIVLSSFSGFAVSQNMFLAILGVLALFQFMFVGIVKSRRPNL